MTYITLYVRTVQQLITMLSQMLEMGGGGLREPWPPEFPPTIFLGIYLKGYYYLRV